MMYGVKSSKGFSTTVKNSHMNDDINMDEIDESDPFFCQVMSQCDYFDIPRSDGIYWYYAFSEFVREEFRKRIDGKEPTPINYDIFWEVFYSEFEIG